MKKNLFFKPTRIHIKFKILDLIEKSKNITQRLIAKKLKISVSLVYKYLDDYQNEGILMKKKISKKNVEYCITDKGIEEKKLLNIWYLISSNDIYLNAKENIRTFLNQVIFRGFTTLLFYGAGDVAKIILQVIKEESRSDLEVKAIIDDNPNKINDMIFGIPIIRINEINRYEHNGILISSKDHRRKIKEKLKEINYPKNQILDYFS